MKKSSQLHGFRSGKHYEGLKSSSNRYSVSQSVADSNDILNHGMADQLQGTGMAFHSNFVPSYLEARGVQDADDFGQNFNGAFNMPNNAGIPWQKLQNWLPGFIFGLTVPQSADEDFGVANFGDWHMATIVRGQKDFRANPKVYSDSSNTNQASWTPSWITRNIVRFEQDLQVGRLEEAQAGEIMTSSAADKRYATMTALDQMRNYVAYYGFMQGENRTFGFLNDPNLPAVKTPPTNAAGNTKLMDYTFNELVSLFQTMSQDIVSQSAGRCNPLTQPVTVTMATSDYQALISVNSLGVRSFRAWADETFTGGIRFLPTWQMNEAVAGDNLMVMRVDDVQGAGTAGTQSLLQIVPSQIIAIGVEQKAKGFIEAYSNSTAGMLVQFPFAFARYSFEAA